MGKRKGVPQGRRSRRARKTASKIERRHVEKERELSEARKRVKALVQPVVQQSLDGIAVAKAGWGSPVGFLWRTEVRSEPELRCNERGLMVRYSDKTEGTVRWHALKKAEVYAIGSRDWRPNKPKSPLHKLAECAR